MNEIQGSFHSAAGLNSPTFSSFSRFLLIFVTVFSTPVSRYNTWDQIINFGIKGVKLFWNNFTEAKKYSTRNTKPCLLNAFFTNIKNGCLNWGFIFKKCEKKSLEKVNMKILKNLSNSVSLEIWLSGILFCFCKMESEMSHPYWGLLDP